MKKCVHCLRVLKQKTKDHVFPSSWYPDNTPSDIQRWTVFSCQDCNNKLGALEQDLFVRLGLCVSPLKAEASGISKRALEALGIGVANLDQKERKRRETLLDQILKETIPYKEEIKPFPGMSYHPDFPKEKQMTIRVPDKSLLEVSKKVLRGCEFKLAKRLITSPYRLEVYFAHDQDIKDVTDLFEKFSSTYLGPGFEVKRGSSDDDSMVVLYRVVIWGTIKIYGAVGTDNYFKNMSLSS